VGGLGGLQLYELATGELVHENASAHSGAVWSLAVEPGGAALLSASADKTVATWSVVGEGGGGGASLAPELSADLGDDAMCARFSPDGAPPPPAAARLLEGRGGGDRAAS